MSAAAATPNPLEQQISERRREISTDSYPMSIGELTNLYRDGELNVHPEFQRFFRWDNQQKSRLVESILLGIPLPSIFVSQASDGTWELVDGLQRVSTIFELQGLLVDREGNHRPPLILSETKFLPSLGGRQWESGDADKSLTQAQRLDVKRAKVDIKIIKRDSTATAKYDLFQRLNSYGSQLTPQELRSCLLVSVNTEFFAWLEGLSQLEEFKASVSLSERLHEEQYDLELILRFLVLHDRTDITQSALKSFTQFLDDKSVELAQGYDGAYSTMKKTFATTFSTIAQHGGEDVFRKWDTKRSSFVGAFLNTSFEVFAIGLGHLISQGTPYRTDLLDVAREFWKEPDLQERFATGLSTERRLSRYMPVGRDLLRKK